MSNEQLFSKMALQAWDVHVKRATQLLESLSDEQLQNEIAPGKNTGVYLIGHLVAVHDAMHSLLGIGERAYTNLDAIFVEAPDKAVATYPALQDLRNYWSYVHQHLSEAFNTLSPDDWFKKHNAVSEEDFAKEPVRNKLNLLINRTNHLAYHLGQLRLLN